MRWKKIPGSDNSQLMDYDKKKCAAYDAALKNDWRLVTNGLQAKWVSSSK